MYYWRGEGTTNVTFSFIFFYPTHDDLESILFSLWRTNSVSQCFVFSLILKEVTNSYFRVCIRDNAGYDGQRSNVIVNYLVIGGNYRSSFISWTKESNSYITERLVTSHYVVTVSITELLASQKYFFLCRNLKILTTKTLLAKKYLPFSNHSFNLLLIRFF